MVQFTEIRVCFCVGKIQLLCGRIHNAGFPVLLQKKVAFKGRHRTERPAGAERILVPDSGGQSDGRKIVFRYPGHIDVITGLLPASVVIINDQVDGRRSFLFCELGSFLRLHFVGTHKFPKFFPVVPVGRAVLVKIKCNAGSPDRAFRLRRQNRHSKQYCRNGYSCFSHSCIVSHTVPVCGQRVSFACRFV